MIFEKLGRAVDELEDDSTLFEPDQLRRRLEALDVLDSTLGGGATGQLGASPDGVELCKRGMALRRRLEEANAAVYREIRCEIQRGAGASSLGRWLDLCGDRRGEPLPGLGYDALDELLAGVLQGEEPQDPPEAPGPEQVFYQPTPVRHVLELIRLSGLGKDDVLIDLGSGLGHVCMLVSMLTGARAVGIEMEGVYVASARACAESLGLSRVQFIEQDARAADLSAGTVFWLYTPFTGSMLNEGLGRLRDEAAKRTIRIGTLGPCTQRAAAEAWLRACGEPRADRVVVFEAGE